MNRILHIIDNMNYGGIQAFIMNIYRNIDTNIIQFDFLLHTDIEGTFNEEIIQRGGKIYFVSPRNKGIIKNRNELDSFFETHKEYKIVHQHVSSLTYVEPLKLAKKHKVPIRIVHSHSTRQGGNKLHKCLHLYNQFFLEKYATNFFACSDLAANWLVGNKRFRNNKYTLIKNGINTSDFIYNDNIRKKIRSELNLEDKFVIGHIGRFSYPKNHEFIIEIFNEILDFNPNSILLLVGDGELRKSIENKCSKLGISNSVIFTGSRSDVNQLLQAIDIILMPSFYEGFPVSLIEAQAIGLKCVISNVITRQVQITDLISFKNLEDSVGDWAEEVYKNKNYTRINNYDHVISHGYDVKQVINLLQDIYSN